MINPYDSPKMPAHLSDKGGDKGKGGSRWWRFAIAGTIGPASAWVVCIGSAKIIMELLGLYESTVSFLLGLPGLIIAIIVAGFAVSFGHRLTAMVIFLFWLGAAVLEVWVTAAFLYG